MALATDQASDRAEPDDLFAHGGGNRHFNPKRRLCRVLDQVFDASVRANPGRGWTHRNFDAPQRILITGVEVPTRPGQLDGVVSKIRQTHRHEVDLSLISMKPQGKFANVNEALNAAPRPLDEYDWIVVADDDVEAPPGFLDTYISMAQRADFAISQPAHCFSSYASFEITRRRFRSLARASHFVEIGPLTVLHRRTFSQLLPFPPSRWCWGIDALWSEIARRNGWRMGIVDAVPVKHLAPVANSYSSDAALREGREMLNTYGVTRPGRELLTSSRLF